jgi:hypothetical protein
LCRHKLKVPLLHFDATSASIIFGCRLSRFWSTSTKTSAKSPSLELRAFQHLRIESPFFHSLSKAPERDACSLRSPILRVWLPSRWCEPYSLLGTLFQFPTLIGFALQSFSLSLRSKYDFAYLFPLLRFPRKPNGLLMALQRS